jgi:hypothetical protein
MTRFAVFTRQAGRRDVASQTQRTIPLCETPTTAKKFVPVEGLQDESTIDHFRRLFTYYYWHDSKEMH